MYEYVTVDITTEVGIKKAEKLKADGWKIITHSLWRIQFERKVLQTSILDQELPSLF
jgi:hypothetical protein